jgi:hypothetical protein
MNPVRGKNGSHGIASAPLPGQSSPQREILIRSEEMKFRVPASSGAFYLATVSRMSLMGHSRPIHSARVPNNVRYASDSDHSRHGFERPLSAKSGLMHRSKVGEIQRTFAFVGAVWLPRTPAECYRSH